jgi:RHH-type transcriptional regulator, proline utilization regulon repressor / proline dehydrogenase / delta 1-pyrroline-5-carboxylate dehydrogenase
VDPRDEEPAGPTGAGPATGTPDPAPPRGTEDLEATLPRVVDLARRWLRQADAAAGGERRTAERLASLLADERGLDLAVGFVDRVIRAESSPVAARQLAAVVGTRRPPRFLSPLDRTLLTVAARIAPRVPWPTMPLARRRLRQLVGHLVVDASPRPLGRHLAAAHEAGDALNLNLLGEAVLGDAEAARRRDRTIAVLRRDDVDYVSIKVSSVVGRLNPWDHEHAVVRVVEALRPLYRAAVATDPPVFVNLDLEEYRDLDLTVDAFMRLLDEDELLGLSAGLALQAYLPDSPVVLDRLLDWADARGARGGADVRIRLVKGANLSMERVEAELAGWTPAPYDSKHETDANYKRLLDRALRPERLGAARIGLASHNLLDQALGLTLARDRGVADRVDVEMLRGMAPGPARAVRASAGGIRLYTPIVDPRDFDAAVAYLVRRLEETASPENFVRRLSDHGPAALDGEVARFEAALADRSRVAAGPRRTQDRNTEQRRGLLPAFANEPDTDPALPANRAWAVEISRRRPQPARAELVTDPGRVDEVVARAVPAAGRWRAVPARERRALLHRVADELAARRADLLAAMLTEGRKTIGEADPEVSEAIDFARWYGDRALELETVEGARFEPLGVVAVAPPWNFPVAIPVGGALASLAAGNAAILKPAPETPRCAEVAVEACHAAGVDEDLLALLRCDDGDAGRRLITHPRVDGVVLTGSFATATRFLDWRPQLRLLAETSGKNALVITPSADLDLAVDDLVASAFGHGGQKCSAASLAICVGDVYRSERFRRQLVDAVESLAPGPATDLATDLAPLVRVSDELVRARSLEPGERWLVEPRVLDGPGHRWRPGVKDGVAPGSFLHLTECFGPVLGLMHAPDLETALRWQHAPGFGLTGGIHTLDEAEIEFWLERVEVGNAYVNRHITGAIVRRQPFGGWKCSNVGPGAKAGGPNYLTQLGTWHDQGPVVSSHAPRGDVASTLARLERRLPADRNRLRAAAASDERWWVEHFRREHDPAGLVAESNVLRYRPFSRVVVRAAEDAPEGDVARALLAALRTGAGVELSLAGPGRLDGLRRDAVHETDDTLRSRLPQLEGACLRVIGSAAGFRVAALRAGLRVVEEPVVTTGRIELLRVLREQAVSRTRHRHGHVSRGATGPVGSSSAAPAV